MAPSSLHQIKWLGRRQKLAFLANTQNNTDHLRKHASSLCFLNYKDSKRSFESGNIVLEKGEQYKTD